MSEITIDHNIDNIQTKLNNLTEGGDISGGSQEVGSVKNMSLTETDNKDKQTSILSSLISFPNVVALILPVLFIVLLLCLKPGFVMYIPDKNKPNEQKLSIQKCVLFGGVTGVVMGCALFFYLNNVKKP